MKRRVKDFIWVFWHTRPGHGPWALLMNEDEVFCGACLKRAPR